MTTLKQIEANRRNAVKSTGPRTENGKRRSRRNAFRHGLTAETVVELLESRDDYRAFEAAIIADYDARTAVERELVLRLASLLWRIRRANFIETDLLRIQAEILRGRQDSSNRGTESDHSPQDVTYRVLAAAICTELCNDPDSDSYGDHQDAAANGSDQLDAFPENSASPSRYLTYCFLRLTNLDNGAFERLGRYEAALWRQIVRTLLALETTRRR